MFRIAIRKNNFMSMISARHIFSTLFFVTNMTKYQEIHARDLLQFLPAPKPVQTFIMNNQSFSESGHAFNAEGGDFRLEVRNRQISMMLGPGLPSEHKWRTTCRNIDDLLQVNANS